MKEIVVIRPAIVVILFFCSVVPGISQRLHPFTSEILSKETGDQSKSVPYERALGIFDIITLHDSPNEIIDSIKYYDIYFKLGSEVSEIGIRCISPIPEYTFADAGDYVSESYERNQKTVSNTYFDPYIRLEYGMISESGDFFVTHSIAENDNSREALAQPNGKHHNALLRATSHKKFAPGIYRIRVTSKNHQKPVEGSYVIHLGLVPGLKGVKVTKDLKEFRSAEH